MSKKAFHSAMKLLYFRFDKGLDLFLIFTSSRTGIKKVSIFGSWTKTPQHGFSFVIGSRDFRRQKIWRVKCKFVPDFELHWNALGLLIIERMEKVMKTVLRNIKFLYMEWNVYNLLFCYLWFSCVYVFNFKSINGWIAEILSN